MPSQNRVRIEVEDWVDNYPQFQNLRATKPTYQKARPAQPERTNAQQPILSEIAMAGRIISNNGGM